MIKHLSSFSLNITCLLLILNFSIVAHAEKFTVKKAKGKTAVIESDTPLEEGQSYELASTPISDNVDYKSTSFKPRQNSLSIGGDFEYVRSDLSQNNQINFQIRYGWNFSTIEFGLMSKFTSRDQGAGSTNEFLGGGYFDYNLVNNRDPRNLVYGPFVLVATGTTQYPSSSAGGSSTKLETNVGGFMTYFLGNSNTAIRAEMHYNYQQINTTAQQNSIAGLGGRGLLIYYF